MKTKTLLITVLLLVTSLLLAAQRAPDIRTNSRISTSYDLSDKTIQGTPYITSTFLPAKISADEEKIYNLRYNAHTDEMEVQSTDKSIGAINKNINDLRIIFIKNNKTYISANYINDNGIAQKGYFVHVNKPDSKISLLKKESKKFIERKTANSGYEKTKPAHFKRINDTYYVIIKNKTAQIIPKKKKDFLKVFPEKHKNIFSFMKKNKIKTSREEDLIELVNYLNTL